MSTHVRRPTEVKIAPGFASSPDEPSIDFRIPTTPGHGTGAGISQETARELIKGLQAALDDIAAGKTA